MIVFEYFYDKMDVFGPKMDDVAARDDPEMEDVCLSLCLLVCLSVFLPVCLSVCLSACLSVAPLCLSVSLSIKLPSCLSAFQSDCNKPVFVYNHSPKLFLPPTLRSMHPGFLSLTISLVHLSWPLVCATMPNCKAERNMKEE